MSETTTGRFHSNTFALDYDVVVVINFATPIGQSVARFIRQCNVYAELWPVSTSASSFGGRVRGVVVAYEAGEEEAAKRYIDQLSSTDIPVLDLGSPTEMTDSLKEALRDFALEVCKPTWTMKNFIDSAVAEIRRQVGDDRIVCGLSGGVDSSVAAALVYRAVGDQLTTIFVDHGLLRQGEVEQVVQTFTDRFGPGFVMVDARSRFLQALSGVADPEEKRKIIGTEFIRVFEEEARGVGGVRHLVQGTLYTDVIESGAGGGAVIKSHHNVGGLPEKMDLKLLEPLTSLFKDEVRALGDELDLPPEIVWRQPFPGPGLAIRVMGAVDGEKLAIERQADAIVMEEIARAGLEDEVWQYFAVLLDTRTVGVKDDARTYGYVVAIRAVNSSDGMTARWVRLPYDVLDRMAERIMREVPGVSRVVYDISSKPPATIEWE